MTTLITTQMKGLRGPVDREITGTIGTNLCVHGQMKSMLMAFAASGTLSTVGLLYQIGNGKMHTGKYRTLGEILGETMGS